MEFLGFGRKVARFYGFYLVNHLHLLISGTILSTSILNVLCVLKVTPEDNSSDIDNPFARD
jgi:hypothetical protein